MLNEMKWDATENVPALQDYPSKLFVETTTHCNLRCPMCVKQSEDCRIIDGDMSRELFVEIEPAFHQLGALVLNGIGEPLMHPHILEFIRRARKLMPDTGWIGFQSNGLLLDQKCAHALANSGLDRLCLSVDGVLPETFSRVRKGEELSDMEQALSSLAVARREHPATRLKLGIEFVVMEENKSQLPGALRWASELGVDFAIVSQSLPYSAVYADQVAYSNSTDQAVEIFTRWKDKMAQEGLDIYRYDSLARANGRHMSSLVDPRLAKVIGMVDEMRAEAHRKGVFLDVLRLLQRNTEQAAELQDIFSAAQKVAEDTGIDLELPAAVPNYERKCPFVEDGSAFISWDGAVHPCYFLWHQFRCFVNDWDRMIKPKLFGRLKEKPLLEIWQSEEFIQFRRNVLEFDYPYCSNCGVAPCDLVQADDFEQDCFTRVEPCGACPWAMGLLQCLQ